MKIHQLPAIVGKSKRRLGRGHGSGRVKTSGRGTKGQKARETVKPGFEGGQLPLIKRLPFLRGRGRNMSLRPHAMALAVSRLNAFPKNSTVDLDALKKNGMIRGNVTRVKVVGGGDLTVALTVKLPVSGGAKSAIEKAGGNVMS